MPIQHKTNIVFFRKTFMRFICFTPLLFPFLLIASSEENSHAFGFGAGLSMMKYDIAVPVPTVSFYWLNIRGYDELSIEICYKSKDDPYTGSNYAGGIGINYSVLARLPFKYLFIGPNIGFTGYNFQKNMTNTHEPNIHYYSGLYFLGVNTALILGEKKFKIKIQNRFLTGLGDNENKGYEFSICDNIGITTIITF